MAMIKNSFYVISDRQTLDCKYGDLDFGGKSFERHELLQISAA